LRKRKTRIIVPQINLRKLYHTYLHLTDQKAGGKIKISNRTLRSYTKFISMLFKNFKPRVTSYEEFVEILKRRLFETLDLDQVLGDIHNKGLPFNEIIFQRYLSTKYEISKTSAKALLSLLTKLNVVTYYPRFVYIKSRKDILYYYILSKGIVSFGELKRKFNWVDVKNLVIGLIIEGLVEVERFDVPLDVLRKYGDRIPPSAINKKSKFLSEYIDRRSGEKFYEVVLTSRDKIRVKL